MPNIVKGNERYAWKAREPHKEPCRTLKEFADYLGIKPRALSKYMTLRNGPESKFSVNRGKVETRFFAFSELKTWWAKQTDLHEGAAK